MIPTITETNHCSRLMRLSHLSPSVNSVFKHACAAIHWGYTSDFWSDSSFTSILYVCEQRRLRRDCADAQSRLSLRCSPMRSWKLITDRSHFWAKKGPKSKHNARTSVFLTGRRLSLEASVKPTEDYFDAFVSFILFGIMMFNILTE